MIGMTIFGLLVFIVSALLAPDMLSRLKEDYWMLLELPFAVIAILDFYKDFVYVW